MRFAWLFIRNALFLCGFTALMFFIGLAPSVFMNWFDTNPLMGLGIYLGLIIGGVAAVFAYTEDKNA